MNIWRPSQNEQANMRKSLKCGFETFALYLAIMVFVIVMVIYPIVFAVIVGLVVALVIFYILQTAFGPIRKDDE